MHSTVSAGQKRIIPFLLGVLFISIAAFAQDLPAGKPETLWAGAAQVAVRPSA